MSTLYEYYNTGDDFHSAFGGATWRGQTFTPAADHKITSVKLKLFRVGSPGTVTVSIRATDGNGHPTGGDLCVGTINGNNLTTNQAGLWYEITLGAGYDLVAEQKYAIVARAVGNFVYWRLDNTSPTYTRGNFEYSTNSGSTWLTYLPYDCMFEEWGEPPPTGTNMKINIGDTFKDVDSLKINIGGVWKDINAIKQNIGDVWKDVFP